MLKGGLLVTVLNVVSLFTSCFVLYCFWGSTELALVALALLIFGVTGYVGGIRIALGKPIKFKSLEDGHYVKFSNDPRVIKVVVANTSGERLVTDVPKELDVEGRLTFTKRTVTRKKEVTATATVT
ncbi:MAG: hypothetical protein WC906_02785 [Parcubacteria group bacterium]|jgi:hypothetical protein